MNDIQCKTCPDVVPETAIGVCGCCVNCRAKRNSKRRGDKIVLNFTVTIYGHSR